MTKENESPIGCAELHFLLISQSISTAGLQQEHYAF
jgi:hypothetical protein